MTNRGLGRGEEQHAAWQESYPPPLISCMMPGIAVLAIVAVMLLSFHLWQRTLPPDTSVPLLEGLKLEEAFTALKQAGLNAEVIQERQHNEEIPEGCIISANPASGRHIKAGRVVHLLVSAGSAYTEVPDVRELPQSVARERLRSINLVIGNEEYAHHPTIPFDRVISVTPRQGARVAKLTTVKLIISQGPKLREDDLDDISVTRVKSTVITADLPRDGAQRAEVRIDVLDASGNRTVYQKSHAAGDTVVQSVEGRGDVTVKVYYGNRLILTRTF